MNSNYNFKVQIFRPIYSINIRYIDPKGTTNSNENNEIAKNYNLDRYSASAYLITLKGKKCKTTWIMVSALQGY